MMLLISLLIGLYRIFRGPGDLDRLMSIQLVGTTGVAILLIGGALWDEMALIDTALILALLAAVSAAAFTGIKKASP